MPDVTKDFPPKKRPYTYRFDEYWLPVLYLSLIANLILLSLVM